jgi:antitoxin MazE
MLQKSATLKVQRWVNSLAVRIPSSVAESTGINAGQTVEISAEESVGLIANVDEADLTLTQKLALFDPAIHGGEVMSAKRTGNEVI